jgi:acyl-CoA thioesterase-2
MTLAELLTLHSEGEDRFRSKEIAGGGNRAFGGQVVAQALTAALGTLDGWPAHSLHAHFLRAGDSGGDMVFEVERLRDGRSFATRQVKALQNGRTLLVATVSAHAAEEGLEHQYPIPEVPGPEGLRSELEIREEAMTDPAARFVNSLKLQNLIELRPVTPRNFVTPDKRPPVQHFWVRPAARLPDDPIIAQAVLTYISDMMLLSTALLPHGIYWATTAMDSASLDHAIWFHRMPQFGDWMLWSLETPWTGAGRGLTRGTFYDRAGRLIASVAQEGLMRVRPFVDDDSAAKA